MERPKSRTNPVYIVRKATRLDASQFGASVGISPGQLKAVEVQRTICPDTVAQSIELVFGAKRTSLCTSEGTPLDMDGNRYSTESAATWSGAARELNDEAYEAALQREVVRLRLIFDAGRSKRCAPALWEELRSFRMTLASRFGLENGVGKLANALGLPTEPPPFKSPRVGRKQKNRRRPRPD